MVILGGWLTFIGVAATLWGLVWAWRILLREWHRQRPDESPFDPLKRFWGRIWGRIRKALGRTQNHTGSVFMTMTGLASAGSGYVSDGTPEGRIGVLEQRLTDLEQRVGSEVTALGEQIEGLRQDHVDTQREVEEAARRNALANLVGPGMVILAGAVLQVAGELLLLTAAYLER